MSDPIDTDPAGREDQDPTGIVHEAAGGRLVRTSPVPDDARYLDETDIKSSTPRAARDRDKVHPELRRALEDPNRPPAERAQVVVTFADQPAVPRFPEPASDEPRDSPRNQAILQRVQELVRQIQEQRAPRYAELIAELGLDEPGVVIVELFWLLNGLTVELPLGAVPRLVASDPVLSIAPRFSGEPPPRNDVVEGRACVGTDPYFALGLTDCWLALLDTGVRFSHDVFTGTSPQGIRGDCVNGGSDCVTGPNLDTFDTDNHGTSSAAILTANASEGANFRGVTAMQLDSFKVYRQGSLDRTAAVRGFQVARKAVDEVIVAEIQALGDHFFDISVEADLAYSNGAVVVAAAGNYGSTEDTVRCPGNAHRSIGVGCYDVVSGNPEASQSCGPTTDDRFKPDLQGPTNTETAGSGHDTARHVFGQTSGATPYVGGAAALVRSWLKRAGSIDPGQVYAHLILFGRNSGVFDNESGAGRLELELDDLTWWGKEEVTAQHQTIDVPLPVPAGSATRLDAALWWPEHAVDPVSGALDLHNDLDLFLVDPAGLVAAQSTCVESVFEACTVTGAVASGPWVLRIRGADVRHVPQPVYWAARLGS